MIVARRASAPGRRPRGGRWLAAPTRFADWPTSRARALLAVLALAALGAWIATRRQALPTIDDELTAGLVDGVRHGARFYEAARDLLHAGNGAGAIVVPLPTATVLVGAMPEALAIGALGLLSMATLVVWHARLRAAFPRAAPFTLALVLVTAGMPILLGVHATTAPESWAGLFLALSLARWSPARLVEAIGWSAAAAALSPLAIACPVVMGLAALATGGRREGLGWAAAVALGLALIALHARALAMQAVGAPGAPLFAPDPGMAVTAPWAATALRVLPLMLAGPTAALAVLGWCGWRDPLGLRVVLLIGAIMLLGGATGRAEIGLLVAPFQFAGLAFARDALRDLAAAALDKRRITVTRLAR